MKIEAFLLSALISLNYLWFTPAFALEPENPSPDQVKFTTLPIKPQDETVKKKSKRAKILSQWVLNTLEKEQVKVAIITRLGSPLAVLFDRTGMTHSGFVFQNPETHEWITYSLYADPDLGYKKSRLWQQSIESFYYGQSGNRTDALMLIPSKAFQEKLLARLTAQPFKPLLPEDEHYNLIAPLENQLSFNCTKWVLLQLFAAQENSDETSKLIQVMAAQYKEPVIKPGFLVKYVLQKKPDVNWQELSPPNHIHTVTVSSLKKSPLFEKTLFYHDR